ncbi:hypothetical protein [Bradyrhizobium sp. CCBAU 51765]|uniref:hypothetical protein n=1 Tax=Bradyrhizobium sp. CCBAU 51765 TaxID=1325102 RepID=UPI0018894AFC|nr:hypothetical protein [Bradyrhizobium sp. CCBAU 51765]QOZ13319.1 hypothetical protein XH96_24455 [Bradyrhizobium sp. CCBAU 51765]
MPGFNLDERVRLSIEMALTAEGHSSLRQRQDVEARGLGMSGAEIDAARRGRSFDAWTSIALALARAACQGDDAELKNHREKVLSSGISEVTCQEIEEFAERVASPHLKPG